MMTRALRPCPTSGCAELLPPGVRRCPDCASDYERRRGTRQQRGYDREHQRLRREWAPKVATGTVPCARCGDLIGADEPWDLGHDDHDRTRYRGPEHAGRCNRSAGGRAAHAG